MSTPSNGDAGCEQPRGTREARPSRRVVLGSMLALSGFASATPRGAFAATNSEGTGTMSGNDQEALFAYVGCRTTRERNARGDGISVYRVDRASDAWTLVQVLGDLVNPSFFALSRDGRHLYTVHGDTSDVSSFVRDASTGKLAPLNRQSTQGRNPVHLALDASGRFLVVANHVTSSLAVLPVADDGSLGEVVDLVTLKGKIGPHRVEQPFAKPHQIVFDPARRFLIVPDKGLDCVLTFSLDPATGKLVATQPDRVQAREGSGPRHAAFHPSSRYAYVVNELDSTLTAYRYDAETGQLTPFQVLSALSDAFTGDSRASEVEVSADGRFAYASNRGQNAVAIFAIAADSGRLTPVAWTPSEGKTPRFFASDASGRRLHVANEDSDTIVGFDRDAATGELRPSGTVVRTGSPVCILFA